PWDCIIAAELFGAVYKPSPRTYLGAAHLLGLSPDQVIMVAAHPGHIDAARSHGLRTAYVPRPHEYGPAAATSATPPEPASNPYDLTAIDFLALATPLARCSPPA